MKRIYISVLMIIMVMGMGACAAGTEGEAGGASRNEGVGEPTAGPGGQAGAASVEPPEEDPVEIMQGDPIMGIVEKYGDGLIVIKDGDDEDLIYYFSTRDARIIEGDSPIAAGQMVEITYQGVMGDEEHPGTAVKVVSESMMYTGVQMNMSVSFGRPSRRVGEKVIPLLDCINECRGGDRK